MKKSLMIIPLVFLLCFTFSCQQGEEVAEVAALSDEDVVAIKTASDVYRQAVETRDLEATIEFYTEDAIIVPRERPMIQGREAIREALNEQLMALRIVSPTVTVFNKTIVKIDGRDNLAFVLGTISMTMEGELLPEPIQTSGKFLQILRKQEDGSWLIAIDILLSKSSSPPPKKE